MKKFSFIIALLAALSLVFIACPPGGPSGPDEDDYNITLIPVVQTGIPGLDDIPDTIPNAEHTITEKAMGKGFIFGDNFNFIKSAAPGSFLRVSVTGTANMNWDSHGAVGFGDMAGADARRIEFKAKSAGAYFIDFPIVQLFALSGGSTATIIHVNVWGDHVVTKVELWEPKEDLPPQDPTADNFSIIGSTTQFLADITGFTIEPKFGMSSGTITTWYEGVSPTVYTKSQTLPSAIGAYSVTFDVAAAAGWNAKTGLSAGTFTIMTAPPFFWDNIVADLGAGVVGDNVQQWRWNGSADDIKASKFLVIETLQTASADSATQFGGIQFIINSAAGWSAGQMDDFNGSSTAITRAAGDTIYIVINIQENPAFTGITNWAAIFISYYGASNIASALGLVKAYLVDEDLTKPAGTVDFTAPVRGYMFKL